MSGGRLDSAAVNLHLGAEEVVTGAVELLRLVPFRAERLDDAMARKRFCAQMRQGAPAPPDCGAWFRRTRWPRRISG